MSIVVELGGASSSGQGIPVERSLRGGSTLVDLSNVRVVVLVAFEYRYV